MPLNKLVDSRDVKFLLFELLKIDGLNQYEKFSDFDRSVFEETLDLAERIAVNHFYPSNRTGDETGIQFNPDTGEVTVPEEFHGAFRAFVDAGFLSIMADTEFGGMGMPISVTIPCMEYFSAGNTSLLMYAASQGAANLIIKYGTDEQKKLYVEKMLSGEWGGDMCITEPEAGTDVGSLKTKALRQPDGTFLISGQKIFISSGEHDMVSNMIHPVLARIEGDPPGTKGISLFIVPKYLVNDDGTPGERNDMICSGIEHKMGLRGSATCSLSFGDNGRCVGYLLGEERKGMKIMFDLMNESRIVTGLQSLSLSSAAYMHAVTYARARVQGPHITKMLDPAAEPVPIMEHPDVRRMLLRMKSYVEGMRVLTCYLAHNFDLSQVLPGDEGKEALGIVELLTPLVKAGNSDTAWAVTAEAIQVHGGYGFCSDYLVEQYARDAKVFSIYEGTNAIQSLDLVMRKILMNQDQVNFNAWIKRVEETIGHAAGSVDEKYIEPVRKGLQKVVETVNHFKKQLDEMKILHLVMNTTEFQQSMFMMVLAWLHLWSLSVTQAKLKALTGDLTGDAREQLIGSSREVAFYSGKVLASQFYLRSEFPKFFGKMDGILGGETAVLKSSSPVFTGAPEE